MFDDNKRLQYSFKMDINIYKTKFKELFDKLLQNNFELDQYYADNLIKYLGNNADKDANKLLETQYFLDLILYALSNIDKTSQTVKIFIMNLLTLVMRNELQFSKLLHTKGLYIMTDGHYISAEDVQSPKFRLACIKQATVQIQHCSGLYWNLEHNIWQQIYTSCFDNQPSYLLKAAYEFVSQLVWKLDELDDEANLVKVLEIILKPIMTSDYKDIKYLTPEIEINLIAQVKPAIKTMLAILDTKDFTKIDKTIHLMLRYFVLDVHIFTFIEVTRDLEFAALTSYFNFLSVFATATVLGTRMNVNENFKDNEYTIEGITYFNILYALIQKRMIPVVIEFAIKSILFWAKMGKICSPTTFQRYGRTFAIDVQLIIIVLVPLMCYTDTNPLDSAKQEGLNEYIQKVSEISSEQVIKGCYMFKELIEESDKKEVVILILRQITRLKGYLSNEQASTIFQALFYVLKRHVPTDESGALVLTETTIKNAGDAQVLTLVIDMIKMILIEHNINWYDSCEVVCLYNNVMNLLKPNSLPSKLVMRALDLINITVKKFLSPDLTLLMETKTGSALNEIGETIKLYMTDSEWEVRDSALQLLLTCTQLSFVKYIPFQKIILANGLIRECARLAGGEPAAYAQAAALRCVSAAARLPALWTDMLAATPNLYMELIYLVQHHAEGTVRKEAVAALTEIYANQKVSPQFRNFMYCVMSMAALSDHWEVQLAALMFWKKAIENNLYNRGMIDGKFPTVTFSRERRKIITLNEDEINRQLTNILNELSQIGCLSVLNNCMSEDINLKVKEQAYVIAKELLQILTNYNYDKVPETSILVPPPIKDIHVECNIKEEVCVPMDLSCDFEIINNQDAVIDSILETSQTELIEKLYENYVEVKNEKCEQKILSNVTNCQVMNPNDFLNNFRNNNLLGVIEEKKNWNSGMKDLSYLLNEILYLDGSASPIDVECN